MTTLYIVRDHLDSPAGRWTCLAFLAVVAIVCFALDARKGSPS